MSTGVVFRSTGLGGLHDAGLKALSALGVRTVCDLRTEPERVAQPDRLPDGIKLEVLDVLADDPANAAAGAADLPKLLSEPKQLEALFANTSMSEVFAQAYRGVVSLPSATSSYRALFAAIAEPDRQPVLFHCTTGKDRTGWGAAALLTFLGVRYDEVLADYLLTNTAILPMTQPLYDTFARAGGDPDLLRPALGVEPSYLETAFEEMAARFGSIDRYFSEGLGLDDDQLHALRSTLVA